MDCTVNSDGDLLHEDKCNCKALDGIFQATSLREYSMCLRDISTGDKWSAKDNLIADSQLVSAICPYTCEYVASSKCFDTFHENYRRKNTDTENEKEKTAGIIIMIILSVMIMLLYQFLGPIATGQSDGDWTLQFHELAAEMQGGHGGHH
eukprot:TRINITY_DN1433_c0_g1_i3.p1 TRINITY_DN1433_c0_g1~~TRINITY_DN1433_c0_g1_i3.p1  ORF type:complete len:150 (-),score=27.35 TRINITY_DN1433_c0_g1_i3:79-528(-)